MSTKYVITFSNCTENGVETPEKFYNQTVLGFVKIVENNFSTVEISKRGFTASLVVVLHNSV